MIKSACTWTSNALSKNGSHYRVLIFMLPILPITVVGIVCFVLWAGLHDLFILCLLVFSCATFLYQEINIIRLLKVASKTSKKIVLYENDTVEVHLFNGEIITLKKFTITNSIPESLTGGIYFRLFPEEQDHATITCNGKEYYLTGTIEKYNLMYKELEKLALESGINRVESMGSG